MKGLDLKCITACNLIWKWLCCLLVITLKFPSLLSFWAIFIIISHQDGQQQLVRKMQFILQMSADASSVSHSRHSHASGLPKKGATAFTLFENYSKCRIWHFPPIFVLLKLTCLVTLFDRKLQVFKNSSKWTIFGHFLSIFVLLKLTCLVTLFDRKLQVLQKLALDHFWHFNQLLSTQNVNVAP